MLQNVSRKFYWIFVCLSTMKKMLLLGDGRICWGGRGEGGLSEETWVLSFLSEISALPNRQTFRLPSAVERKKEKWDNF